jgi:hypothetical protein
MKFPLSSGVACTVSKYQHTLAATETEVGVESRGEMEVSVGFHIHYLVEMLPE